MASEDVHSHRLTVTQQEQQKVEYQVLQILSVLNDIPPGSRSLILELWRDKHIEFLMMGLIHLGPSFRSLDANRPWLCYWILHSAALLGEVFVPQLEEHIIDFLSRCQDINGGYCGGPGQMPHLATTYAAVNSLLTLGGVKALSSIDRQKMSMFLRRMKDPYGGFRMHDGGEMDTRACYTAISVASILNILDYELVRNVGDYILSCQTYEGGIAGEPGSEAHGGYTFCGLATLVLINRIDCLDLPRLIDWLVFRQGELEGGFQGRTNKLVDGCYSFWQGAVLDIIRRLLPADPEQLKPFFEGKLNSEDDTSHMTNFSEIGLSFLEKENEWDALFDSMALQQYILLCSQDLVGGFKDKPGKLRDYYHTCYCLSGLSVCQHSGLKNSKCPPTSSAILGPHSNRLEPVHPLFNIILDRYDEAYEYFSNA